jgi:hypothetical protein
MVSEAEQHGDLQEPQGRQEGAQEGQRSPRLIVPMGRGSRGKTLGLRWVIERAGLRGHDVVVADIDRTNRTLSEFFENVSSPETADDRDVTEFLEAFVERQIAERFDAAIDFGGGDLTLKSVAREIGLTEFLESNGISPVAVHFIGADVDDLSYLQDVEENGVFAPEATVLVLNEAAAPPHLSPYAAFRRTVQGHPVLMSVLQRGGKLVHMPRLGPALEVDQLRVGFYAAARGEGQTPLGPWKRQQVANWLRQMEESFKPVADWLP